MSSKHKTARIGLGSFDLLKGLGVILFIFSHTYTRYDCSQSVVLSGLQLILLLGGVGARTAFYVISGITFRETTPAKMLKKTFRSLMIPYFWVAAAYGLLFPLVRYPFMPYWREVFMYAIRYVAAFLLGNIEYGKVIFGFEIYWCTPMYFFLSMFIALNLLNLILKFKNSKIRLLLVCLCVVVGNILLSRKMLLFSLAYGLPAVGFCYTGYLLNKNPTFWNLQNNPKFYLLAIPVYLLGICLNMIENPGFFINTAIWALTINAAILMLFCSNYVSGKDWKGFGWLKIIGVYSYWIICIHSFETEAIPWFMFVQAFSDHQLLAFVLETAIKTVIITSGCLLLKKVIKWKYRRRGTK